MFSGMPSDLPLSVTPISREAISLYPWRDFNETCHIYSSKAQLLKKGFQGQKSKVKVIAR